jgi:uncharacterized protein YggE
MFQDAYMRKIVALVGIAGIIALGAYTYSAVKGADYMDNLPITVSVTGEGEVFAKPDIATFSFTVAAKEVEASAAQSKSADAVNAIIAFLAEKGVEDRDVKTQGYNLNPQYEYPEVRCTQWGCPPAGEPKLTGYEVAQTIEVKVRKTDTAGELIAGIGGLGATNVSGLSFTIDDESALKAEAREEAIADAKAKAEKLAEGLGVRIVRMSGYWEEETGGGYPMYYGMEAKNQAFDSAMAPSVPMGENTITSRVSITYEVE